MKRFCALVCALLPLLLPCGAAAQQTTPAALLFQGLRSVNHQGSFKAATFTPDGNLVLLVDQGDGLRLLKTDSHAQDTLAQIQLGASGDQGVALAADPAGNLYVAGTSASGALAGTPGAVFPSPADTSLNSFVAKFDSNLNLLFLTFLGAPHTVVTGVAVTADAAFLTGSTYSTALPVTANAVQPTPASGTNGNGFVERFASDGTSLRYATYLTGPGGDTTPTAVVADASDNAFIAGSTSSSAFPTREAIQPLILGPASGFLLELSPAGNSLTFSTYIPGAGLASLALDPASGNLLATGNLARGAFPLLHVTGPLANTTYQALVRLTPDGQTLLDSTLLLPGDQSSVTAGPNGTAWVTGTLSVPASGGQGATSLGDSYLLHLTADDTVEQLLRFGGSPTQNPAFASLTSLLASPALNADASLIAIPGTITAFTDPSLVATQTFDLPLAGNATPLVPNTVRDLLPSTCTTGLPCSGSGSFLTELTSASTPATLALDTGDLSNFTLRNPNLAPIAGLTISPSGYTFSSNCPQILDGQAQCGIALSGAGPGSLNIGATGATTLQTSLPALENTAPPLAFDTPELDFGIVTAANSPSTRSVTVTNLTATARTFISAADNLAAASPFSLAETASTCSGTPAAHTLPANASCTLSLSFTASSQPGNDTLVHTDWKVGARDIVITGFTQAAPLALSAPEIDFAIQVPASASPLPRFLYLSNGSTSPVQHAPISTPTGSPFTLTDNCPSTLQPNSVCQIGITYTQTAVPALDTLGLTLDQGLTVVLKGETSTPDPPAINLATSPFLVSPPSLSFNDTVPVSGLSSEVQTIYITNPTATALPLSASVLGDFILHNACATTLAAGTTCDLTLQFTPSEAGPQEGLLTLSAGPSFLPTTVPISATATPLLAPSDASFDLGQTAVGEPVVQWFQVQGSFPQITAAISGTGMGVALLADDGNGHGTLNSQAFAPTATAQCIACWLGIQFLPTTAGATTALLHYQADPGGRAATITINATAMPSTGLLLSTADQPLQATPVHSTSAPQNFVLTNLLAGAPSLVIQAISTTGDFTVLASTSPASCSTQLAATASCSIQIAFTPSAAGRRSGTLTVETSGGNVTASLTGTGTPDPGLALSPTALDFTSGTSQSVTLTNTGPVSLSIGQPTPSNSAFTALSTCATLSPGQSCSVNVTEATPSSSTGQLTLPLTSTATDGEQDTASYTVPLLNSTSQNTGPLTVFPTQADVGTQTTNAAGSIRQFQLTNSSSIPQAVALTATRNFPLAAPTDCGILAPAATCTFSVLFLPQEAGPLSGSIAATPLTADGAPGTQTTLYLQSYGLGSTQLTASEGVAPEAPLSFGQITSGQNATQSLTITNTGTLPASIRRLTTTAPFHAEAACPAQLAPGATCSVSLTYAPVYTTPDLSAGLARTDTGTLLIESDDDASPRTVYLSGTVTSTSAVITAPVALPTYTLSPSALTFPNTLAGNTSPVQTVTLTNTGTVPILFANVTPPSGFQATTTCSQLQPTSTCSISVAFTPTSAANTLTAEALAIYSNAAVALDFVTLLGSSFQTPLQLSPANLTFDAVAIGSTSQQTLSVTNSTTFPIPIESPVIQGDFSVLANTCPGIHQTLAAGATCSLTVTFTPTASGSRTGSLSLQSTTGNPTVATLQGTGLAGHLQPSSTTLAFGSLALTQSATQTLTLTNTGTAALIGLALTVTGKNATDFSVSSTCGAQLSAGKSCTAQITFAPSSTGPRTATLSLASSDPASPALVPLTGTGTQPPGFTLTVNGASSASATLSSGASTEFPLALTPQGGYNAPVTLACQPMLPAANATCTVSPTTVPSLNQPSSATATIATASGLGTSLAAPAGLTLLTLPWCLRRKHARKVIRMAAVLACALPVTLLLSSCAGGPANTGNPYTPPGVYTYQVTATSAAGTLVRSTVTLTLTVR